MHPQSVPSGGAQRPDARSLIAAGLCVLALFFDLLGWILGIAGIVLLRKAVFSGRVKALLALVAIAPKILFVAVRWMNAPAGLSFPIEARNLATSPSLWAWSVFLAAFGVYLMVVPQPVRRRGLVAAAGILPLAAAAVVLLGLIDGFHRIDYAGGGQWALRHAARGEVAVFTAGEVASIEARERRKRSGSDYAIRVTLAGGRTVQVSTGSAAALDELRKFAVTADLAPGKLRIFRRNRAPWSNGASGLTLKDCVGTYEAVDAGGPSHSTYEFWLDAGRLAGRETVAGPQGRHVRVLRNIKLSESGEVEFEPGSYLEAAQTEKGKVAVSFGWSAGGERARFRNNGFEVGTEKYRKR